LHLMLNYFSLVSGRKKERVAATWSFFHVNLVEQ
jgi:hypothetical protein